MTDTDDTLPQLADLLARAAGDAVLRERLLRDPRETLIAEGFDVPEGMTLNVFANDARRVHLVLPPAQGELSEAELDAVAGGGRLLDRLRARNGGRLLTGDGITRFIEAATSGLGRAAW